MIYFIAQPPKHYPFSICSNITSCIMYYCKQSYLFLCLSLTPEFIYLFFIIIIFRLRWVFVAVRGLSLVAMSGDYSSLRCTGFSLRWLLLLQSTGSRHTGFSSCSTRASVVVAHGLSSCGAQAPESRLSSCGARAQLLCGMWDLPGPGLKPVSPALAGRFSTTAPPGRPYTSI